VIVDEELAGFETFFCGGGSKDRLLELRVDDVKRLTDAIVAKISA
jgi:prolyl-tRNA editing enzyme YbaK/EbsC (Cys-tRNA(Pro) deacylase)